MRQLFLDAARCQSCDIVLDEERVDDGDRDAARIDGATRLQTMFRIFLPLCTPGFISAGIFAFTLAQNEFLYALIFLTKTDVRTVPVGAIAELVRGDVFYWGQLMAAALLGCIPVAIIYSFFVEHYVAGLTSGGVKA